MRQEEQAPSVRLDGEKIELLRRWGSGLAASGRDEELRAAGRAILLLIEELDAVQRDLWHARAGVSDELAGVGAPQEPSAPDGEREASALANLLHRRLAAHLPAMP